MIEIKAYNTAEQLRDLCALAEVIWTNHYTPIIGSAQVRYMLDKFQSERAVTEQITSGYTYYGIELDGKLQAYFSVEKRSGHLFLSKFYVAESSRGKGLGKEALRFIEGLALNSGLEEIQLTVNKYNKNSIAYYQHMGFEIAEAVVFDIGQGYIMDDYRMVKDLRS